MFFSSETVICKELGYFALKVTRMRVTRRRVSRRRGTRRKATRRRATRGRVPRRRVIRRRGRRGGERGIRVVLKPSGVGSVKQSRQGSSGVIWGQRVLLGNTSTTKNPAFGRHLIS